MNWLSQSEEPTTLRPQRSIGGVTFDVVVEEQHEDTLEITEHPSSTAQTSAITRS